VSRPGAIDSKYNIVFVLVIICDWWKVESGVSRKDASLGFV